MTGTRLSDRLAALAAAVPEGARLADIGTDHAWIPVALLCAGRIPFAYACDIGTGPLKRAEDHIAEYGLSGRAETRLSDGLHAMVPGECDAVLIAGMGGELMTRILREGMLKRNAEGLGFLDTVKRWILSPHTEWEVLRGFLRTAGLAVVDETMVLEEGKFYPVIQAAPGDPEAAYSAAQDAGIPAWAAERFGPILTLRRHPAALQCMRKELENDRRLLRQLAEKSARQELSDSGKERIAELTREIPLLEKALGAGI